jgi:hypothetical protein
MFLIYREKNKCCGESHARIAAVIKATSIIYHPVKIFGFTLSSIGKKTLWLDIIFYIYKNKLNKKS